MSRMSRFAASGVARSSASSNSASAARLLQLPPTIHAASIRVVANSIAIALHAQSTTHRTYLDIGTAVRTRRRSTVNHTTCVVHNPRNSIDRPTRACRFVAHLVVITDVCMVYSRIMRRRRSHRTKHPTKPTTTYCTNMHVSYPLA